MIVAIGCFLVLIAIGIGIGLFVLGRVMIRKSKESHNLFLFYGSIIVCIVFAIIALNSLGFSFYFLSTMVDFVNSFPG